MKKVIKRSIIVASIPYAMIGFFGYLSFAKNPFELIDKDKAGIIIMANYGRRFEL